MPFTDRRQAGTILGRSVAPAVGDETVVLALPRGGVPVGFQVALALGAPLDVIVVRKLGVPSQPELAMGAIGEDGVRVMDPEVLAATGVGSAEAAGVEARERTELEHRVAHYRSTGPRIPLTGRTAVVVDDGIATGSTARAACLVARAHGAVRVIVAVPVASPQAVPTLHDVADQLIAVEQPQPFVAVGRWYDHFGPVADDDVLGLLEAALSR